MVKYDMSSFPLSLPHIVYLIGKLAAMSGGHLSSQQECPGDKI